MRGAEKLRIHPLFFAAGILSAFTGKLLVFLSAVLAALEHECAHAFAARRYGFVLDRVVLMPYGAVISGDLGGIPPKQEIAVCLAGPLANALTALLFISLWWLFPETYAYTDVAAYVSVSLCLVNLLPAWPLDGGRILRILLSPLGERRAMLLCRALTLAIAAVLLGLFIWSCFSEPAFSALFFALLLAAGAFGGGGYRRMPFSRERSFSRGVEEIRIALSADATVQDAIRYLREDRYLTLLLFEAGTFYAELSEEELLTACAAGQYANPLKTLVSG